MKEYWEKELSLIFFADTYHYYQYPIQNIFYELRFTYPWIYTWNTYMLGLILDGFFYAIVIRLLIKLIFNLTAKYRKPKEIKEENPVD